MRLDFFLDYGPAEDKNIKQVAEEASETDDKTDEKQMMTRHMQPLLNPFPCTPNDPYKHKPSTNTINATNDPFWLKTQHVST